MDIANNKISFTDATKVLESLFTNNIGTTEFQAMTEEFICDKLQEWGNMDLIRLTTALYNPKYVLKHQKLQDELFTILVLSIPKFDIRQLETLFWTLTRKQLPFSQLIEDTYSRMLYKALMNSIYKRCVSMKARGLKYILNGLSNINFSKSHIPKDLEFDFTMNEFYDRLEKVIVSKLNDFVNHDLVEVLWSFHNLKVGTDSLYSKIFQKLIDRKTTLRPAEFIKFFRIFPQLEYIYQNNISDDLWDAYCNTVSSQIYKKSLPFNELLEVFSTYTIIDRTVGHSKLFYNMVNQIRGSVYKIPAEHFTMTLFWLMESQIFDVADKFIPIVQKLAENNQIMHVFKTKKDCIRLLWCLATLEELENIIQIDELHSMIDDIEVSELDPLHFKLFIQFLNISGSFETIWNSIDYDKYYEQIQNLDQDFVKEIVNNDPSTQTSQKVREKIRAYFESYLKDENEQLQAESN